MPPPWRNQRPPAACDTPTAFAASSGSSPFAIWRQNSRSTSRRSAGAPGDFIEDRPVNAAIHPAGLPTNTSEIEMLRPPVESTNALRDLRRNGAQDIEPLAKVWTNHGGPVLAGTYHLLMDVQDARPGSPWLVLDAGIRPPDGFWTTDAGRTLTKFGVAPDSPILVHPRPRPALWAAGMRTSHFPSNSPTIIGRSWPTAPGAHYQWTSADVEGLVRIVTRDLRALLAAR